MPRATVSLTAILILLAPVLAAPAMAQEGDPQDTGWSESVPLNGNRQLVGGLPRIAVDRQGRAHLFWTSWLGFPEDKPYTDAANAIFYRRLDAGGWTEANDVLVTGDAGPLIIGSVAVDERDHLNLLWFDQGSTRNLFLSQAHTSAAADARNWTTQVLEQPALAMNSPDLVARPGGRLDVVYALDHAAILHQAGEDYGASWSGYTTVWHVIDPGRQAATDPRIAVDGKGYLHVVWTVNSAERSWQGEAVYYARSTDGGSTWQVLEVSRSLPEESTTGWIGVAVRLGHEIHLAWNRGIGSRWGRYHSWSPDNGLTWSEPTPFLPEFVSGPVPFSWQSLTDAALDNEIMKKAALDPKVKVDRVTGATEQPTWQQPF